MVLKPCSQFENIHSVPSENNELAYINEDANLLSDSPAEKEDSSSMSDSDTDSEREVHRCCCLVRPTNQTATSYLGSTIL